MCIYVVILFVFSQPPRTSAQFLPRRPIARHFLTRWKAFLVSWAERLTCSPPRLGLRKVSQISQRHLHLTALAVESNDPEFDEFSRHFEVMEKSIESLLKDSKVFADAVVSE